jgi:hypothetical protein
MARAAQVAGEATTRRFDASREKGSAASAVACFMRDMLTLRQGLDIMQPAAGGELETPKFQPAVQPQYQQSQQYPPQAQYQPYAQQPSQEQQLQAPLGSPPTRNFAGVTPRSSLIRRPSPMYVDADNN